MCIIVECFHHLLKFKELPVGFLILDLCVCVCVCVCVSSLTQRSETASYVFLFELSKITLIHFFLFFVSFLAHIRDRKLSI